jgi:transmembrane sensor
MESNAVTESIEQRAGEWLAQRDAGEGSVQEQEAFEAWLNESAAHRIAYWRLENAWNETLRLRAFAAGAQSDKPPPPGQLSRSPFFTQLADTYSPSLLAVKSTRPRARMRVGALAASLVLAAILSLAWYLWPGNVYETPVGGMASVPIADGSKVTLNTNSEIKVAITHAERRVDLKQGEAFFEVAKDPSRPFIVIVADKRVVAVGTAFSVRRDNDDIKVVVTEGAVRIDSLLPMTGHRPQGEVLTAGSIATAGRNGLVVRANDLREVEARLAWRSGGLVFNDVPLSEAIAEFNRYSTRKIVIKDPGVAALTIGGNFRTSNVEVFVRLLERGCPIRAEFQRDKIVLTAR